MQLLDWMEFSNEPRASTCVWRLFELPIGDEPP